MLAALIVPNVISRPDEARVTFARSDIAAIMSALKMYLLDNTAKTYSVLDLPIDYRKLAPKGGEQMMEQMSQMAKMDVAVTPRDETKKIGAWTAKRYDVVMTNPMGMKIETTMWVSKDVGVDVSALTQMAVTMTALKPGTMDWIKKMQAIPGYPVLQESKVSVMGNEMKTSEQLVAVEKKEPPAGTYEPPAGYTLKPFDPMGGPHQ